MPCAIDEQSKWAFWVDRANMQKRQIETRRKRLMWAPLVQGQSRIQIERLAFSANNILYMTLGDKNGYWDLFPGDDAFGCPPAWGVGRVVETKSEHLSEGERLFGFFPIGSHCVLTPTNLGACHILDVAPNRMAVAPAYNRYSRLTHVSGYDGVDGDWRILLRPLAVVGMLVAQVLADNRFFEATSLVITSASSKTGIGVGSIVKQSNPEKRIIGVTAKSRVKFVQSLNVFDEVTAYGDYSSLQAESSLLFDLTGSVSLVSELQQKLSSGLLKTWAAGRSHKTNHLSEQGVSGLVSERFFAPLYMSEYLSKWGGAEFEKRFSSAIEILKNVLVPHLTIDRIQTTTQLSDVYDAFLGNTITSNHGYIIDALSI
jgi:hypothetical protein